MNDNPNLVIVDDDLSPALGYYVTALEERGYAPLIIPTVERARDFFKAEHPQLRAIVLDIMMPPGQLFAHEDHADGTRTGVFLYRKLIEWEYTLRKLTTPVAVLTNVADEEILGMIRRVHQDDAAARALGIWSKGNPVQFAEEFDCWLKEQV
jgi:CheY-like chemotaxis protein